MGIPMDKAAHDRTGATAPDWSRIVHAGQSGTGAPRHRARLLLPALAFLAAPLPAAAQTTGAATTARVAWDHFMTLCDRVSADPAGYLDAAPADGAEIVRSPDDRIVAVVASDVNVESQVTFYGMPAGLQTQCSVTGRNDAAFAELIRKYATSDPGLAAYGLELAAAIEAVLSEADILHIGGELSLPADPGLPIDRVSLPHYRIIAEFGGAPRYGTVQIVGGAIFLDTIYHPAEVQE